MSGGPVASGGELHPRIDLGAYLLAILPPAEEAAITAHLAQCDDCVLTLMNLADTLPALRRLDAAMMLSDEQDAIRAEADGAALAALGSVPGGARRPERSPSASVTGIAAAPSGPPARRRSSRRVRWAAGLAAAAAAAAVVLVPAMLGDGPTGSVGQPSGPTPATSSPSDSPTGGTLAPMLGAQTRTFEYTGSDTVTVTYAEANNGSAVNVRCQSGSDWKPQPGDASRTYELWIVRQDGEAVWVRTWPPVRGDATFPGWVDFLPQQFKTFQLRDGEGHVLAETDA